MAFAMGGAGLVCQASAQSMETQSQPIANLFFGQSDVCTVPGLDVVEEAQEREVRLVARTVGVLEATVTLSVRAINLTISKPLPHTADVAGSEPIELVRLHVKHPLRESFLSFRYAWRPGSQLGVHDDTYVYTLPYDADKSFGVGQGRLGALSHGPGSGAENAIDFDLPEGTTVRAARPGIVVAVRDGSEIGGPEPKFGPCANFVIIRHADGTYANYAHFMPRSALVKPGRAVGVGTPLALSGKTGYATGAHLHFEVFKNIDGEHGQTFAVSFATSEGVLSELQVGHSYRSP